MSAPRVIKRLLAGVLLGAASSSSVLALDTAPTLDAAPRRDAAPTIDACALLDAADIQKALGVPVEKGSKRDSGREPNGAYSSACVWTFTSEKDLPVNRNAPLGGRSFVILNAQLWPRGSDGPRSFLDAFREASESGVISNPPSPRQFGDEALWWGDGLAVRRREVGFGISVFTPRDTAAHANAQPGEREGRLAKAILARLAAQDSAQQGSR